jgi:trehalose-phosphatase
MPHSALPISPALARRLSGRPFMLLLDVDGTLAPIAPRPEYAVVPPETQRLLRDFSELPRTFVAVISGRSAEDARRLVCGENLWVIGNHGIEVAAPHEPPHVRSEVAPYAQLLAEACARFTEIAARESGVLVEDKRWTLSVHHRLAHPRIVPDLLGSAQRIAEATGLRLTRGKEVIEIRPPIDVDKGTAAVDLARSLGALEAGASLLSAGDDRTDEDAFRALRAAQPNAVTVRVGTDAAAPDTIAEFCVEDTDAMRELLSAVLTQRRTGAM